MSAVYQRPLQENIYFFLLGGGGFFFCGIKRKTIVFQFLLPRLPVRSNAEEKEKRPETVTSPVRENEQQLIKRCDGKSEGRGFSVCLSLFETRSNLFFFFFLFFVFRYESVCIHLFLKQWWSTAIPTRGAFLFL